MVPRPYGSEKLVKLRIVGKALITTLSLPSGHFYLI